MDYITSNELREYIGSETQNFQATADAACTVASRRVESLCDRRFSADTVATALRFNPCGLYEVEVEDISTTSGLIVQLDTGANGHYDMTLTLDTDFTVEPFGQRLGSITGYPYTCLRALSTRPFIMYRTVYSPWPYVQVTAKWGWPAVPDAVKHATLMVAAQLFKMKDAADGFVGLDGWGPTQPRELRAIRDVLGPYMKAPVAVG